MRTMGSPGYVYTPRSPEVRAKLSAAHRKRLGIPQGHRRIYGVHVPDEHEIPLRHWANWVRQKRGWDAASQFVSAFLANGSVIEKPSPDRVGRDHPNYNYVPRTAEVKAKISAAVLARLNSLEIDRYDWNLLEALFSEGMTIEEVAEYARANVRFFSRVLTNRRRARRRGEL